MKFTLVLIAACAAIHGTPADSAKARSDSLANSLKTVATQNKFEADHGSMHATNMANADNSAQTLKNSVRSARNAQVAGGDQYPPFKTY